MLYNRDRSTCKLRWYFPLALMLIATSKAIASAQIVPDNTLPQNSIVAPNGDIIEITGGTAEGNNLFHSFEQFSVLDNQTAFFDNTSVINNIIGRVTGGSLSEINGLIKANGTANLFLLNPNGIIFSENASLDIGGSFISSTADSIQFADGKEFSAVNPNANPLLTVSIPMGLQYGGENGDITVEGSGNNLFIDFNTFTVDRSDRPVGLSVDSGNTLALAGGNVFLDGANLTAPEGNIELGSVGGESTVTLTPDALGWKLGYESVENLQNINLSQAASLEASGNSGGRVRVKGDYVSLTDGSAILTDTLGDGSGGSLIIEANETEIYGVADNGFTSSTFTNVDLGATGDAGDALIDTGYLYLGDGAQVNVNTFGLGDAGTLKVKAGEIEILGGSVDGEFPSGLFAQADIGQTGKGGDIDIEADYLLVADGAQVSTTTFGEADAGTLTVKADEIELIAGSAEFGSSGLFASSEDLGNGGNLTIESGSLYIADGAQAVVSAFGAGDGGSLTVTADEIELVGTSPGGTSSGLFASSEGLGNGGNLTIESNFLFIADGAQIASSSFFDGNGGSLTVNADEIELVGTSPGGTSSGLFANSEGLGKGGNLNIESNSLYIADGAQAIVATFGAGDAGNSTVIVDEIELVGTSPNGIPSGLFGTVGEGATGNSGNLQIEANNLYIADGAQIAVSTAGSGNGGILNVDASNIELIGSSEFGSSGLFSNAIRGSGDGGKIDLTSDRLSLVDGATISASNFSSSNPDIAPGTGAAGKIDINVNSLELDSTVEGLSTITAAAFARQGGDITIYADLDLTLSNGSQITAETRGDGDGGSINIAAERFNLNNQGQVSVNSTGLGQAGDIAIAANTLDLNQGNITATSIQTGGGEINLATDSIFLNDNSLISTSVLDSTGGGGDILIDNSDFIIGQNNSDIRANAVLGQGGNIQIDSTGIFLDFDSEITASSQLGVDGVVEIDTTESDKKLGILHLPNSIDPPEAVAVSTCPVQKSNTFTIAGSGGLPDSPLAYLRGQAVWQDMRLLNSLFKPSDRQSSQLNGERSLTTASHQSIVESQEWIINHKGNVELVAVVGNTIPQNFWQQAVKCGV